MPSVFIVGAGLSGATCARLAADAGFDVTVVEKRNHVAGNAHDKEVDHGEGPILVHTYGPHIFHTNSKRVFDFLSRFTQWTPYEHRVLVKVGTGGPVHVPMPVNADTIEKLFGVSLPDESSVKRWLDAETSGYAGLTPDSALQAIRTRVGDRLAGLLFDQYTRTQWGHHTDKLLPSVTNRIPVRTSRDDRYFTDSFQFMPTGGFTKLVERMLDHPLIRTELNCRWSDTDRRWLDADLRFFSGRLDEFHGFRLGRLPYRSIGFQYQHLTSSECDSNWVLPSATVNLASEWHDFTRCTEMGRLTGCPPSRGTVLVTEKPRECLYENDVPAYPVPTLSSKNLTSHYEDLTRPHNTHMIGRLGRHQYLNMDQAVAAAITTFEAATAVTE